MIERKYSLFTTIAMIVGIVIGSGIFFKSDNVLVFTNGNIIQGVLVFVIAAFSIVFGSLAISELASRTDEAGGVISYAEEYWSKPIACAFGWFQTLIYLPTITAIVAWVVGIYTTILFGIESTLEIQVLIGVGIMTILYLVNILSYKFGGYLQNASTIIKLIPLILIAFLGLAYGNPKPILQESISTISGTSWIAAIAPIAFSFDGWIVSTSIGHEIKDSKRNLPIALVISPIIILLIYVLYFVGISTYLGPAQIIEMGDAHVNQAAIGIFGAAGAKAVLTFVVISVIGTVNGLIIGLIRLPYALSIRNMFPGSSKYNSVSEKYSVPVNSGILTYFITVAWMGVHYITQKYNLLPNSDISEISIVLNYVGFILLYISVLKLAAKGQIKNKIMGYAIPILAIFGSLFILYGGMQNPLFIYYFTFCIAVVALAMAYYKKHNNI